MSQIIDTPCVGICSTVYGDEICRGCKRRYTEVIEWNQYSREQKQQVYERLNLLADKVLPNYLQITDSERIQYHAEYYKIRRRPEQNIYSLLFSLLYWEYAKITDSLEHGFVVKPEFAHISLEKLVQVMDEEMYGFNISPRPLGGEVDLQLSNDNCKSGEGA